MDNLIRELVRIARDVIASEIDINGQRYVYARHIVSVEYEEFVKRLDDILTEANQLYQDDKQYRKEYVSVVDEWMRKALFKRGSALQKVYNEVKKQFEGKKKEYDKAEMERRLTKAIRADSDLMELAIYLAGAPTVYIKEQKRLDNMRKKGQTINVYGEEIVPAEIARKYITKLYKKDNKRIGDVVRKFKDIAVGGFKGLGEAQKWGNEYADRAFERREKIREQAPMLERGYAREFFEFLPAKPLRITLDASSGELLTYHNRFRGQGEELRVDAMASAEQMKWIIEHWNETVKQVWSDCTQGGDNKLGLIACIVAVIIHTGLRPGRFGNGIVVEVDGKLDKLETFGVVTMLMKHLVTHVRKGFATIKFRGKKGVINVATISNSKLTKVLWKMVQRMTRVTKKATDEIEPPKNEMDNFFTDRGVEITYHQVWEYFKKTFGRAATATTFRKLKATQEVYDSLKEQQKNLMRRIKRVKLASLPAYEEAIINQVVGALKTAFTEAAKTLSHKEALGDEEETEDEQEINRKKFRTVVDRYVNPTVVMGYLSGAGLQRGLEDLIGYGGKIIVKFDAQEFAKQTLPRGPRRKKKLAQAVVEIEHIPGNGGLNEIEEQVEDDIG